MKDKQNKKEWVKKNLKLDDLTSFWKLLIKIETKRLYINLAKDKE